ITDDWDEASTGIEAYAADRGWWRPATGRRFAFRAAFENPEPRYRAEARYDASCRFLDGPGRPDVADLMRHLRDHYDGGTVHRPGRKEGDPRAWSVCMHPDPAAGATAASMVVELARDAPGPVTAWCSMTTPCTSPFLPVSIDVTLPGPLESGSGEPDDRSAWWLLKALGDKVAIIGEPPTLDAHGTTASLTYDVTSHIYEPLFTLDDRYGVIPMLAESHSVDQGGRVWTIRLRKGVPFHNGKELSAEDAVASI